MFPVVTVTGSPYDRGHQYGQQAADRVRRSIAAYREVFQHCAGWDWSTSTAQARRFLPAIQDFGEQYVEEMTGIAAGAGVELDDVLAINVRTEVMYSARVRNALELAAPAECSAFSSVGPDGRVLAGQNWDWAPFAGDTVVILQAIPDDGPRFVTVVEAGLMAKFGVNSHGVAVMTNALACTEDRADAGVPYHVLLRGLLESGSAGEAVDLIAGALRASSANYLVADKGGTAVDVEARPGGPAALHRLERDERGVLLHTNHFISGDFDATDYSDLVESTSRTRLKQVGELVAVAEDSNDLGLYEAALIDHANAPDSVCRHPDPDLPGPDQSMTVASILVDLTAQRVRVAEGPPCEQGFEELDVSWLWD